jgi:hypothetical protein
VRLRLLEPAPVPGRLTGLTQYSLARRPLAERGPIGHEKTADDPWLREHGVHFVVSQDFSPVARFEPRRHDEVLFGDLARARPLREILALRELAERGRR